MVVHCSSNVILLAIEYFSDSKRERQNIKLLSTQNNYSPLFGFISSDKTDKKLWRSWKYKTRRRMKRRGGQGNCQGMAFDILGDPGADSGDEGKSKRAEKCGTKKSKERREEPLGTMSYQTSSKRSPPFWLLIGARKTSFLAPIRSQNGGDRLELVW